MTNRDPKRLDGDAVRLADGARVRNLAIAGPLRGGIYGKDVANVLVAGVDVSGHNTSCTPGFLIPPFQVPTLVTGVGVPISDGLTNGWAGIMVDVEQGRSKLAVLRSRVRDADCGDGIDVRISGDGNARARIGGNAVRDLREGPGLESILAIGLQTRDRARLVATLDDNRQSGLGNDEDSGVGPGGADTEGVFVNPTGASTLRATVTRNRYIHTTGRGAFSSNGLEYVSMGDGSRGLLTVRDSTFRGTPGDVIEQLALGTNATLRMRLQDVTATDSTGFGDSGFGDTVVIPGNNGDCLIAASGGAGNTVDVRARDVTLTGCANNGFTLGSSVANGQGPTKEVRMDLRDSRIEDNQGAGLRIGNLSGLGRLDARIEHSSIRGNRGQASSPGDLVVEQLGTLDAGTVTVRDSCFDAGGAVEVLAARLDVDARSNWWSMPAGPRPGGIAPVDATVDTSTPLVRPPEFC